MFEEDDQFKKKREEYTINIRKNNREDLLNKRRNLSTIKEDNDNISMEGEEAKTVLIIDGRYREQIEQFIKADYDESEFDALATLISTPDIIQQHRGMIGIRKLLSKNVDPPISKFVDRNLIFICIMLAKQKEYPQLKLEATWALTNVASGASEFCQKIYEKGGIELFVNLLKENEKGIVDQAIWGIGNISVDHVKYRDEIIKSGGMEALIKVIESSSNKTLIKNGSWAVTNLCRGNPPPKYPQIKEALPFLCKIVKSKILEGNNKEVLSDVIWAISIMSEGNKSKIEKVHNENVLEYFFRYALDNYMDLCMPALKIIGNFSNGNENHTQSLLDHGIFELALALLNHQKKNIRMEMCWILSNVAAGVEGQVKQFMQRKDVLDKIANIFNTDVLEIRKEICWIYANLGHLGDKQTLIELCLHYDIMRIYANLLNEEDSKMLEEVLETLNKLLIISKKCLVNDQNVLLVQFLNNGGGEKLENLQKHPNKKVYESVIRILTRFFEMEEATI